MSSPFLSKQKLKSYLLSESDSLIPRGIGVEYEGIPVLTDSLRPVPLKGERSIQSVLEACRDNTDCEAEYERDSIVALEGENCRITTEPGGQIELSGSVKDNLCDIHTEIREHFEMLKDLSAERGIGWLSLGLHPFVPVDMIGWSNKRRYAVMSRYLEQRGPLAHSMMKQTAGIQLNLDYHDEEDAVRKIKTAMGLTSAVSAIFANSPIMEGELTGMMSYREYIWQYTDPDRCGLLKCVFEEDFDLNDYVDYMMDIPMLFIERDGLVPVNGISFRKFNREGYEDLSPELPDWKAQLSTIFTEVRIKNYMELRGADNLPVELGMSLLALWKGIIYSPSALDEAWDLVSDLSWEERQKLHIRCLYDGLGAEIERFRVIDIAKELVKLAEEGLKEQSSCDEEVDHLEPAKELVFERGKSPAELLAEKWCNDWEKDPSKLIEYSLF